MAVAFDSLSPDTASAGNVGSLTSGSWTPSAGAAFGFIGTGASSVAAHSAMRYGGAAGTLLTQIGASLNVGGNGRLSAWRSTIPAGATTAYGLWAANQDESCIGMVSYTGADGTVSATTTNVGTFASSTSFTPTVNVTTNVGDVVIACVWWVDINGFAGTIAAGTGCTARYDVQGSVLNAEGMMVLERVATGASTTMSATVTAASGMSGDWGIIAFVITPSAGGGGGGGTQSDELKTFASTRNRPGRGPYSLGRYFRPRVDAFPGRLSASITPAGGLTLGGSAAVIRKVVTAAAGGITLAGAAAFAKGKTVTPVGGITLAGAASQNRVRVPAPSGGLNISGAATVSTSGSQQYSYSASGGISLGGSAAQSRVSARAATGGLQLGGAATVTSHESTRVVTPSGGLSLRGSAAVTTNTIGGGGGNLPIGRRRIR